MMQHKLFHAQMSSFSWKETHLPKGVIALQGNQTVAKLTIVNHICEQDKTIQAVSQYKFKK